MAVEELVGEVVEEVATNLEEVASATRGINPQSVGYFLGGVGVGAVFGFYFGYKFNREKIKAEAFKESEEEIERIRETYQQKTIAATPKPPIEELVEKQGYAVEVPVGIVTQTFPVPGVTQYNLAGTASPTEVPVDPRPLPPPVPGIREGMSVSSVPEPNVPGNSSSGWNYDEEIKSRTIGLPYVIHADEIGSNGEDYSHMSYTYYDVDGVLVDDEDERPVRHPDQVVGLDNLKFGHGTEDQDIVYIRNDRLRAEMEITRVPHSYEETVLGRSPHDSA